MIQKVFLVLCWVEAVPIKSKYSPQFAAITRKQLRQKFHPFKDISRYFNNGTGIFPV